MTLLALLYDSGARVQELVDLRLKDVRLTHPPMVILTGKGRKVRQVPLMKDTCKLLDRYIRSFHSDSQSQMIPLFYNAKKQALSRYGVTYILKMSACPRKSRIYIMLTPARSKCMALVWRNT